MRQMTTSLLNFFLFFFNQLVDIRTCENPVVRMERYCQALSDTSWLTKGDILSPAVISLTRGDYQLPLGLLKQNMRPRYNVLLNFIGVRVRATLFFQQKTKHKI